MKSSASLILAAATFALLSTTANAAGPSYLPSLKDSYIGCFKPTGDFELGMEKDTFQSSGACRDICRPKGTKYSATTKKFQCYCGNELPPESDQVQETRCNLPCAGFKTEPCGSNSGHLTIFLTDPNDVDDRLFDPNKEIPEETQSSTTSSTSAPTSTSTTQETTTVSTLPEQTTEASEEEKEEPSGINKAGAAAGAVVGVLVAIAIGVGAFIFIRKQRRNKVEEEYRRSLAVREYQKKPEADLRLDPVMLQRRMSDGSIADNQDYSRRILKVTNPDGM